MTRTEIDPSWPAQIRLPGQTAAYPGPVDMTMMYVMHHAFRRDLDALTAATWATPPHARSTWQALARRWRLFAWALHHHHTGEDRGYWPLLAQRVAAADLATLEAMAAEHIALDPVLDDCEAGFERMASDPSTEGRDELVRCLASATVSLDLHLAHEETDAIPLLQAHITPEEDEQIEVEHFRGNAPVARLAATVPWALHGLPDDVRELVLERTGVVFRLVWQLTRHRFARQDAEAMRFG